VVQGSGAATELVGTRSAASPSPLEIFRGTRWNASLPDLRAPRKQSPNRVAHGSEPKSEPPHVGSYNFNAPGVHSLFCDCTRSLTNRAPTDSQPPTPRRGGFFVAVVRSPAFRRLPYPHRDLSRLKEELRTSLAADKNVDKNVRAPVGTPNFAAASAAESVHFDATPVPEPQIIRRGRRHESATDAPFDRPPDGIWQPAMPLQTPISPGYICRAIVI
jgi:hypothetical protein